MSHTDYPRAIAYSLHRLETKLSPNLFYHSYWHTREDVMVAARRLSLLSDLQGEDLQLLEVAAAYHDIGYLHTEVDHELAGIEITSQVLPSFGFTPAQVSRVNNMILATRLPQSPTDIVEAILADADLDVLGREDFFERSELLRQEHAALGRLIPTREWAESQLRFISQHVYFTQAARDLRQMTKLANIAALEARLLRVGNG
jgi:predicted metal-dependent HD superfamily phosphohydrolase